MEGLPETVLIDAARGGLRRIVIATAQADAEIYLQGAHVTHFQPRGRKPVLFMSEKSSFELGKPIRGGVPICFPWFGPRQDGQRGPAHGFARLMEWELMTAKQATDGSVEIGLRLASSEATRKEWDGEFEVEYWVKISGILGLELRVRNMSTKPMRFEEALHTYLLVSDVRQVGIEGLEGASYVDRVGVARTETETAAPIRITSETDRIYMDTRSTCVIHDPGWQRRLLVEKTGSDTTVVWNPWIAKAKAMPDFGDDEWPSMLCIEASNVCEQAVTLAHGQLHSMKAVVRSEQIRTI